MFIFLTSVIVVTLVSFCFFRKDFWEYRYLVLLLIGGVSLIATLATNYAVRGRLGTKSEIVWSQPLYRFYLPDSLLKDKKKTLLVKEWAYLDEHKTEEFYKKKDKTVKQVPTCFVIYTVKGNSYVGYFKKPDKRNCYGLKDVCFARCSVKDTIAYICKKRLVYNVPPSKWLTGFSFPQISTETIMYVPARYYAQIPDSLIRKPSF